MNAAHWREQAERARAAAAQMQDPARAQVLLSIATAYEKLAVRADRKQLPETKP